MSVYASTPGYAEHRLRPRALTLIVAGHAALIAAAMAARMDLPVRIIDPPIIVTPIPLPLPVPAPEPLPKAEPRPRDSGVDRVARIVPAPSPSPADFGPAPAPGPSDPVIGNAAGPAPRPMPAPLRVGPRFATPPDRVEPPYPMAKRQAEEEAALRLRLTIDARGRVVAVDPVGPADPVFLQAARRHILARWRYAPASEDGRAIASSTVITLRFELER